MSRRPAGQVFETLEDKQVQAQSRQLSIGQDAIIYGLLFAAICVVLYYFSGYVAQPLP